MSKRALKFLTGAAGHASQTICLICRAVADSSAAGSRLISQAVSHECDDGVDVCWLNRPSEIWAISAY